MIFFTSDTHFSHFNIIKYCKRPFSSIEEMDQAILANWSKVVGDNDIIYHLGDVALGGREAIEKIVIEIKKLPGKKYLLPGNHDKHLDLLSEAFQILPQIYEFQTKVASITEYLMLCHYPMLSWNIAYHQRHSLMLHGHVHGSLPQTNPYRLDVGVDSWDYQPVSFSQILARVAELVKLEKAGQLETNIAFEDYHKNI